jgi:hypothetical protein
MKKVFALLMAVLYLTVSTGLAVEIHHCMGEITDFSLTASTEKQCSSCGMAKGSNNCCKDELKFVKLQDAYKLLNVDYKFSIPQCILPKLYYSLTEVQLRPVSLTKESSHGPPYYTSSLCILHSTFRI